MRNNNNSRSSGLVKASGFVMLLLQVIRLGKTFAERIEDSSVMGTITHCSGPLAATLFWTCFYLYLLGDSNNNNGDQNLAINFKAAVKFQEVKNKFNALKFDDVLMNKHRAVKISCVKEMIKFSHSGQDFQISTSDLLDAIANFFEKGNKKNQIKTENPATLFIRSSEIADLPENWCGALIAEIIKKAVVLPKMAAVEKQSSPSKKEVVVEEVFSSKARFFNHQPFSTLKKINNYLFQIAVKITEMSRHCDQSIKLDAARLKLSWMKARAQDFQVRLEQLSGSSEITDNSSENLLESLNSLYSEAKNYFEDEKSELNKLGRHLQMN